MHGPRSQLRVQSCLCPQPHNLTLHSSPPRRNQGHHVTAPDCGAFTAQLSDTWLGLTSRGCRTHIQGFPPSSLHDGSHPLRAAPLSIPFCLFWIFLPMIFFFFFNTNNLNMTRRNPPGLWFFLHLSNELPSTSHSFLKEQSTLLVSTSLSPIYSLIHSEPPPRPSSLRSPGARNYQIKCPAPVPTSW